MDVRASGRGPNRQIESITTELIAQYGNPGVMLLGSNRIKKGTFKNMNKTHGITRIKVGENRNQPGVVSGGRLSAKNISGTRARAAAVAKNRENFRFQYINKTLTNAELNSAMNMLIKRINSLPALSLVYNPS